MDFFFFIVLLWLFTFGITDSGLHTNIITVTVFVLVVVYRTAKCAWIRKRRKESDYDKEHLKNIEDTMKSPKGIVIVDYEERIRRNLLLVSIAAIAFPWLSLEVDTTKALFGVLTFKNLTQENIYWAFFGVLVYEFLHYFWIQLNNFAEWRIRLTGTSHPDVRGGGGGASFAQDSAPSDYSGSDQNTNFYTWMFESKHDRTTAMTQLLKMSGELQSVIEKMRESKDSNNKQFQDLISKSNSISTSLERLEKALQNIRVDASMLRFDEWFRILVASQNFRWLILDIALPLILGLVAFFSLIKELF